MPIIERQGLTTPAVQDVAAERAEKSQNQTMQDAENSQLCGRRFEAFNLPIKPKKQYAVAEAKGAF